MDESTIKGLELLDMNDNDAAIQESRIIPPTEDKIDTELLPALKFEKRQITVRGYDSSLPRDAIERTLIEHFSQCGEVSSVIVPGGPYTEGVTIAGGPYDIASVHVRGYDIEEKAVNLNGQCKCEVEGCKIVVHKIMSSRPRKPLNCGGYQLPARFYSPRPQASTTKD